MQHNNRKILIVDDAHEILELAAGFLEGFGMETVTAGNAADGLKRIRSCRPDLVLSDISMPGMDGYGLLAEIRADPELANTPVVLMTGVAGMQDRIRAVNSGADDLLTKPFDGAELISRTKALLRLRDREEEVRRVNFRLHERIRLLSTLFLVANELTETVEAADVYAVIRSSLETIIGAGSFTIYVCEEDSPALRLVVCTGPDETSAPQTLEIAGLPDPVSLVVSGGRPFVHKGEPESAPMLNPGPEAAPLPLLAVVPLAARGNMIGLINLHSYSTRDEGRPGFEMLSLLSSQVAGAIHATRLHRQLKRSAHELKASDQALQEADKKLGQKMFHLHTLLLFNAHLHSTVNLAEVHEAIRELAVNFIGAEVFYTQYEDDWAGLCTYVGIAGGCDAGDRPVDTERHAELVRAVMETGTSFFRERPDPNLMKLTNPDVNPPVACLPLLVNDRPYGVFVIERLLRQKERFSDDDYSLLALLTQEAALAIRNGHVHQHVERLSVIDSLTGAFNRRSFDNRIEEEVRRCRRYSQVCSLVMCDIDDFKRVNDRYGHPAGDEVLREVVRRIDASLRSSDLLTRYGGEEFALLMPSTAGEAAVRTAERVRKTVAACPVTYGEQEIPVTISMGVSTFPECDSSSALIAVADQGLLEAKAKGKNRVVTVDIEERFSSADNADCAPNRPGKDGPASSLDGHENKQGSDDERAAIR